MGGACCLEKELDGEKFIEKNKIDIIKFKFKELEHINKQIIKRKYEEINNDFLSIITKAFEIINFIKEEMDILPINEGEDEINKSKSLEKLNIIENELISEIKEKIIIIDEKTNNLFNQSIEYKNKAEEEFKNIEPLKIKPIEFIKNIDNELLENFIHQKNPTKQVYLILKLIFLIINPEERAQIPGLIIKKDLEIMENECFNIGADKMKQIMIERLNDVLWINNEFLEDNKIFMNFPFNDLKEMEKMSELYKNIFGYFNCLINYKRFYDIYESLIKKSEDSKKNASELLKIKEQLKIIINKNK